MTFSISKRSGAARLLGLLALLPAVLSAQTSGPAQEADWRRANDVVGALRRGHVDVLKWEQAHLPPAAEVLAPAGPPLPTAEAAVRAAWALHPDLARPLARLGTQHQQHLAQGRWMELDPTLQVRVDGMDEVLAVAVAARKAWLEAVAARQMLQPLQTLRDASQAALELGQRMVTVGNWSALQFAPIQLAATQARMNLRRAQLAAELSQIRLGKTLGQFGTAHGYALPDVLPPLPEAAAAEATLQRAEAARRHQPYADHPDRLALARTAAAVYRTAHALAQDRREDLKVRTLMAEETLLHYNGMLKSVWDLLEAVRNQSQAGADAVAAQRDFWIAEADLQWELQGGAPGSFVNLGGPAGDAPAAAH